MSDMLTSDSFNPMRDDYNNGARSIVRGNVPGANFTRKLDDDKSGDALYVKNIPLHMQKHELEQYFKSSGIVPLNVRIFDSRPNFPDKCGIVKIQNQREGLQAIDMLDNRPPLRLSVSFAKKKKEPTLNSSLSTSFKHCSIKLENFRSFSQCHKKRMSSEPQKRLSATHFVAMRVSNSEISEQVSNVQKEMAKLDPITVQAQIPLSTLHITLFVLTLENEELIDKAGLVLNECEDLMKTVLPKQQLKLSFQGVGNFSGKTVFAKLVEDENFEILKETAHQIQTRFSEKKFCLPDNRKFSPHLTIAKISRMGRSQQNKLKKRKLVCPDELKNVTFGVESVNGIELLSMMKPMDEHGYYFMETKICLPQK